jgi:alpha-aminoadipic semialdehyde synthase
MWRGGVEPRLRVIGDISCDIEGSIEATVRCTEPDNPVYVYNPLTGKTEDGCAGEGPVILAVDNLPAELPREASESFSMALMPFVPSVASADFTVPFDACDLPGPIRRAVIVYQGELTEEYSHLSEYLASS